MEKAEIMSVAPAEEYTRSIESSCVFKMGRQVYSGAYHPAMTL